MVLLLGVRLLIKSFVVFVLKLCDVDPGPQIYR